MSLNRQVYDALSRLITYPRAGYGEASQEWASVVRAESTEAGELLDGYLAHVESLGQGSMEELYARTFDNSPGAALELGWHVHGESYDRGASLVRLREILRDLELNEGGELPDHLSNVLAAMAHCDAATARTLAEGMVEPAVKKICVSLAAGANPYEYLLDAVLAVVNLHLQEAPSSEPC